MPFDETTARINGAIGGRIGGATVGATKRRGPPAYYRDLVEKRLAFTIEIIVGKDRLPLGSYRDLAVAIRMLEKGPKKRRAVVTHYRKGVGVVLFYGDKATVTWESGESTVVFFRPSACRRCGALTGPRAGGHAIRLCGACEAHEAGSQK